MKSNLSNALRHLRIVDLELLLTAAHLKNLSKAAALHNLSQSGASAAIQRVERAFDQALCHHERRQFRLTHEGHHLLPRIEEWLKQFREQVASEIRPPLRLATTHAIARVILPELLPIEPIDLLLMRPDRAYRAVLEDEADLAIVPDNFPWVGVQTQQVGSGIFGLFASAADVAIAPVLLPENQLEVLNLLQRWNQLYDKPLEVKSRIPSWSLIADLCSRSREVGFLPDFLAKMKGLYPVAWQPETSSYRLLALHRSVEKNVGDRLQALVKGCRRVFER